MAHNILAEIDSKKKQKNKERKEIIVELIQFTYVLSHVILSRKLLVMEHLTIKAVMLPIKHVPSILSNEIQYHDENLFPAIHCMSITITKDNISWCYKNKKAYLHQCLK